MGAAGCGPDDSKSMCQPARRTTKQNSVLDGVAGGFGGVGAPGWGGPPEGAVGKLVHCPFGVLLEAVVVAAFGAGVAEARASACLIRDVVLVVALGGGAAADGAGAGGVPDLGQVPQRDPGIVAAGLVPVVAGVGGDRVDRDDQVRSGSGGAQPPGPGIGRGLEREPWSVSRAGAGAFPVTPGFGPGAAVGYSVALVVGDGQAPGGPGAGRGGGGQVAGQPGVDRAEPG